MKPRVLSQVMVGKTIASLLIRKGREEHLSVIDAADVDLIRSCRALYITKTPQGKIYVQVTACDGTRTLLHRLLLGIENTPELDSDHIDGQTLNNRRCNLRAVPDYINLLNRPGRGSNTGVRGVTVNRGRFYAKIGGVYLGQFRDIRDAAETVWLCLLAVDPISASRYLRELPALTPFFLTSGANVSKRTPALSVSQSTADFNSVSTEREGEK